MRILLAAAALAFIVALGLVNAPKLHAAPVLNITIPFTKTIDNACNPANGPLTMTGETHLVAAGVLSGTTHAKAHVNMKGTAVDAAGNRYQLNEASNGEINLNFPLNQTGSIGEAMIEASALLISQGPSPNLVSHTVTHVVDHFDTNTATGTVTFLMAKCQG